MCVCVYVWGNLNAIKKDVLKIYFIVKKALQLRTRSVCRIYLYFKTCFVVVVCVYTFVVSFELVFALCQTKAVDKISSRIGKSRKCKQKQ